MIEISGKLISKSFVQTGTSKFGSWKRIDFVITKTYQKEKYSIPMSASGKWADLIENIAIGQRLRIRYIPIGKFNEANARWYCNNKAVSIEKWVKRERFPFGSPQNLLSNELLSDNQLSFYEPVMDKGIFCSCNTTREVNNINGKMICTGCNRPIF